MAYTTINGKLVKKQNGKIPTKNKDAKLVTFYWGFKADQGQEGFEFSNMTCEHFGIPFMEANTLGALIKQASDDQLDHYTNNTTQQEYGLTREELVAEEWDRLHGVINNFKIRSQQQGFNLQDPYLLADIMFACCAISTLVAAGEIEQDEWNGDKFGHIDTNLDLETA